MENLQQYRERTRGFMMDSLSYMDTLQTNPNLSKKVYSYGGFCPFIGDTMIFELDKDVKQMAEQFQKVLYEQCGEMFAEKVIPDTFHVTLHDLSNGEPSDEVKQKMESNKEVAKSILQEIQNENASPIKVRVVSALNMVNTSVVLGLEPADDASCLRLMELYERFQPVVRLNYALTLHITLAYYKPGTYSYEQKNKLAQVFTQLREENAQEFYLDEKQLVYQWFSDMNNYYSV
ncbi:MAG: hypothetical protein IKJ01_08790 [Lachnospiraceae bacterium]|nr:hypothetical protein [Lachnospiraceae bacterium]